MIGTSGCDFKAPFADGLPRSEAVSLRSLIVWLERLGLAPVPRCWNWTSLRDLAMMKS